MSPRGIDLAERKKRERIRKRGKRKRKRKIRRGWHSETHHGVQEVVSWSPPPLSQKGIEVLPGQDIARMEEGMSYLESSTLTIQGVPFMIETLVGALFQISMLSGIKNSHCISTNAM